MTAEFIIYQVHLCGKMNVYLSDVYRAVSHQNTQDFQITAVVLGLTNEPTPNYNIKNQVNIQGENRIEMK